MDYEEIIQARRLRKGEWVDYPLRLRYHAETHSLEIACEWRKRLERWAEVDLYRVESIPVAAEFKGSGFLLYRSAKAIEADPEHVNRYETLIGQTEAKDICSCRGYYGNDRCKHAEALRWLIAKLAPPGCVGCGLTDCELVDGYCSSCEDKRGQTEPATAEAPAADLTDVPF